MHPSSLVAMQHPVIQLQVYFLLFNHLRTRSSPPNVSTTDACTSIQCYNRPVTTASRYLMGVLANVLLLTSVIVHSKELQL